MWRNGVVVLFLGSLIGAFAIGVARHGDRGHEKPHAWTMAIRIDDRAPADGSTQPAASLAAGPYELHEIPPLGADSRETGASPTAVTIRLIRLARNPDAREYETSIVGAAEPRHGATEPGTEGAARNPVDRGTLAPDCCQSARNSRDGLEAVSPARAARDNQEHGPPIMLVAALVANKQPKTIMSRGAGNKPLVPGSVTDADFDMATGVMKQKLPDSGPAVTPDLRSTDGPDEVSTDGKHRVLSAEADTGRSRAALDDPAPPDSAGTEIRSDGTAPATVSETGGSKQIKFKLSEVSVEGATVYAPETFLPLYRHLLDTEVTLDQVFALAKEITARYGNDGYILAQAVVPPQRITRGVVRIQVVEGRVNAVTIEGDVGRREGLFRDWAEKIKASRPLNSKVLERYTLLANDLPGATVKAVLQPHKGAPGTADVVLVVERKTFDVSGWFDNRAPKTSGPFEGLVSISGNSLLGLFERTSLTYSAATDREQSEFFGIHHQETLDSEGTTLSLDASHSRSEPGDILKDLGLQSESTSVRLGIAGMPIRSRDENLTLSGSFTYRDVDSDALSARLFEDRLRVVTLGGRYEFVDRSNGANSVALRLHQGLGILGASRAGDPSLTRSDGSGEFTKLTANLSRTQYLGSGFSILLAGTGQLSSTQLLASEEFSVGGALFGRGYDPSEITGDHGLAGVVELRFTDQPDIPLVNFYQLYSFWDFGMTYDIDAVNQESKRSAASAGLGVRFGVTDYVSGYLEVAKPLTRPVALEDNGKDPRFFFRLSTRF